MAFRPQPALTLSGTIIGGRRVDVPARPSDGTRPAYDAFTYAELDLQLDCSAHNGALTSAPSYVTVRLHAVDDLAAFGTGEVVALVATPFVGYISIGSRRVPEVQYRYVSRADSPALSRAS